MEQDAGIEPLGPVDHRAVVVRVGDGDRLEPATRFDRGNGRLVDEGHAVPEQRLDVQRPLADRERRLEADAEHVVVDVFDACLVTLSELLRRRPPLPVVADVLALVETDRTRVRRLGGVSELRSAGYADVSHCSSFYLTIRSDASSGSATLHRDVAVRMTHARAPTQLRAL